MVLPFDTYLNGLDRLRFVPNHVQSESIQRWADDFGAPATDGEWLEALESGQIAAPDPIG